jgi:tetratricopeptide (TPR) repeat protein
MLNSKIIILFLMLMALAVTGFQCASTELTSAKLYIQQKNYDKALESLNREVDKNPKSDEGYYLMGVVHGEKEEYEKMVDAFDKSLSISNKFQTEINASRQHYWGIAFNRGVSTYQAGTKATNEDSIKVYFDRSIKSFQTALLLEPDSSDAYKNLAFVHMTKEDYDAAIEPLEKLIETEDSQDGYRFLGEILYNKGVQTQDSVEAQKYYERAISVLEEGRKKYPSDSDMLLTLSNAYIAANKVDVAIDAFKAGVEAEPDNKYYKYNYGVLLLGANNFEAAEEQFLKAIEIDPDYENAIYNLAVNYVRWGSHLNKVAEEKGEMDNQVYKQKYEQALPYLERVVELKSDDAAMWELLGRVYTVLGYQDKATKAFETADSLR